MAVFKPVISTIGYGPGNGLELFVAEDIYRYDVDNRPLENLADNDVAIKDSVDGLVDEITDSYTGKLWPDGTDNTYAALDGRLDNMDLFLSELFEIRNVQFSAFQQFASFLRERYTSGFMNGPYPNTFVRSNYTMENNEAMPSPFGGYYVPELAQVETDINEPDIANTNMIALETRIEQDNGTTYRAAKKPMFILVNGFVVPFYNAHGGTSETDQSVDDRRGSGVFGPCTINFPPAPTTGHRFDFAFLEVFLNEVVDSGPFYPYGSRDWTTHALEDTGAVPDGIEDAFSGTAVGREIVKYTEAGWGFRIYVRDDTTPIDYDTETPACEDNGSGALVGANCNGTLNYSTGAWAITFDGGSEPAAGKVLVAVYIHKAVADANDSTLAGTISFLPNGTYLQVQHQIRVIPGLTYETYPNWFTEADGTPNPEVEARGDNATEQANYTFSNALNDVHDGSLFRAGSGDSASISDLGTYDGYVFAVPLCAWSRFNTTSYSNSNQNGGVDRLDGLSHSIVDDKHFLDLRPVVFSERYDMRAAAENTLERIMRGDHRTIFGEAQTDEDGDNTWVDQGVWGSVIPELWRVEQYSGAMSSANQNVVRDIGLATSDDPTEGGFVPPRAWHDGVRQIFSPQEEVQQVAISIDDVTASNDATPAALVTYAFSSKTITVSTNDSTLSGYSASAGEGVIINNSYPRLFWRGTRQPVVLSTLWTGLGTNTATAVIDTTAATYVPNGTIDGFVDLLYPESTGIARPVKEVDAVEFDDGVNSYVTREVGNKDGSADTPDIVDWKLNLATPLEPGMNLPHGMCLDPTDTYVYVCDAANNRVVRLLASDMSHDAQWPTLANYPVDQGIAFEPTTDLKYPVDVACDASGNVYVVDRDDHRMLKLNAGLTSLLATFGTSGTSTNDPDSTTLLNSPEGVTVDSAGNVFIADTGLFRLIKLNSSLVYQSHLGDGYSGAGLDQFFNPMGLDVGNIGGDDYVYVADQTRIVQIDATQMTFENILGSENSASVQQFRRHTYTSFWGFAEDADGNKYACNGDRDVLVKFDAAWNILKIFGEDGVKGWKDPGSTADVTKQKHLYHARDLIFDDEASLIYLVDNSDQPGDGSRIIVFNTNLVVQDILYLNTTSFNIGGGTGLAFFQSATTGGKLYVGGGGRVIKFALPIPGSRGDTSLWSEDWLLDNTDTGFTGANQLRHLHDITLNAAGTELYLGDVMRGEIIKVNASTKAQIGSRCDVGYAWPPPLDEGDYGSVFGIELSPDENHLWVCGCGDSVAGYNSPPVPHIRSVNTSTMAIDERWVDTQNWIPKDIPFNIRYNKDGTQIYMMMDEEMLVYDLNGSSPWLNISGSNPGDIAGSFSYNINDIPVSIDLGLGIPWVGVRAVQAKDSILYMADPEGNTITAVHMDSLRILGQINSPAMVGRGFASTAGPSGVCVLDQEMFLSDMMNNRLMKGYRYWPSVERGTGRLSFLIAPPSSMNSTFQVRYAPYQGQWNFISEGAVYGRHFVTDNGMMYISTMGRGTPTRVSPASGTSFYSNMLSHLPMPIDVPSKGIEGSIGARIKDEYLFAPQLLAITESMGSAPFLQLPILNRFPSSAQEVMPWYGGGSRFDFNRFFFLQGPGPGNAVSTGGTPLADTDVFTPRGFYANSVFPGFDTVITFPLTALSVPRVIFSTMTVELNGQGYLLIYAAYRAGAGNTLNDGSSITADVFRLFGSPGIKTRY
jgi:sugar lactone lactonase YvrE